MVVPPNHPILIGFSIIFTIHFGGNTPYFWKHPFAGDFWGDYGIVSPLMVPPVRNPAFKPVKLGSWNPGFWYIPMWLGSLGISGCHQQYYPVISGIINKLGAGVSDPKYGEMIQMIQIRRAERVFPKWVETTRVVRCNLAGSFQYFLFSSLSGEDEPILTHIFQMGWFNHQLVMGYKDPGTWTRISHGNL